MSQDDIDALMRAVSAIVKEEISKTAAALTARIEAAERVVAQPGRDGRDADQATIRAVLVSELASLPKPTNGKDGEAGRDALDLVVLDGIKPDTRYPRGTCATHRGGVVKAFRATDPLGESSVLEAAGWQVLLNGIAEEHEVQRENGRIVQRTTTYTNGQSSTQIHRRQVPIYRGVLKSGSSYEGGDVVTYGGSLWICSADARTSAKPGDGSAVWTLCVKRGKSAHGP